MTRAPVCPVCGSTAVSPDASNGGAGRNVCHCGHRAPVRDFYPDPVHARVEYYADRLRQHLRDNPVSFEEFLTLGPDRNEPGLHPVVIRRPAPGCINYVTERVAAVLMPNGELNDMRHNREPAPIRQYKDED